MCRFAVRNGQAAAAPLDAPKLEAQPINLDALFGQGQEELDASGEQRPGQRGGARAAGGARCRDAALLTAYRPPAPADLALLALFSGQAPAPGAEADKQQPASAGSSACSPVGGSSNTVVVGQALTAPATQHPVAPGLLPPPPANPVQQLQFQAVLQHQAAIMQNPGSYPAAAQMYQQAMLQTSVLPAQPSAGTYSGSLATGAAPVPLPAPVAGKRGKTQEEIEEQTERIKKRRRESAQRRCEAAGHRLGAGPRAGGRSGASRRRGRRYRAAPQPFPAPAAALAVAGAPPCAAARRRGGRRRRPAPLACAPRAKIRRRSGPAIAPRPARSRQRKNAYMKSLEMENRALKLENERLRCARWRCWGMPRSCWRCTLCAAAAIAGACRATAACAAACGLPASGALSAPPMLPAACLPSHS